MKRIYAALLIILLSTPALAMQTSGDITLNVLVEGNFNLMVNTDSFDFASIMPGQTGEMSKTDGVAVTGSSSNGNLWFLKVSAEKPLTSGNSIIANENFSWYGTSEGTGAWKGIGDKSFAENDGAAYISSVKEADEAAPVTSKFKFKLFVPEETKAGEYTTLVMFTMTE
jgi:hypothetical protein